SPRRAASRTARDPQLRSRVRRFPVAPRFPPRLAQGAHLPRAVAAPARPGHTRRSLALVLPSPVVSLRDRRGPGAWALPGDPETRSAPGASQRQRRGDDRRGSDRRASAAGDRSRENAALQSLPERQAGVLLGDARRTPDGDARWRGGTLAGVPQRGDPGVGRDRVQPPAAPRTLLFAGRTLRPSLRCAPPKSFQQHASRSVSHGRPKDPTPKRWDDLGGGRAFRGPRALSPLPQGLGALCPLGPSTGRSGRSSQWNASLTPVSSGPQGQRRRPTAALRTRPPRRGGRPRVALRAEAAGSWPGASRSGTAAASATHPRRVFRHGTSAGVPAEESAFPPGRNPMNAKRLLSLWGLKWNPFSPELPSDGLLVTAPIENFAWRVEQLVQEGGFALICGESGTGKSVALRIVAERLAMLREVAVGVLERPQSRPADFYRELGDVFSVKLASWNSRGGFKALRERWRAHVTSSRIKPLLLVDEAQEMSVEVL